jgi:hypothetical protein
LQLGDNRRGHAGVKPPARGVSYSRK